MTGKVSSVAEELSGLTLEDDTKYGNPGNVDALLALFSYLDSVVDLVRLGRVARVWREASVKQLRRCKWLDLTPLDNIEREKIAVVTEKLAMGTGDSLKGVILLKAGVFPSHIILRLINKHCRQISALHLLDVECTKELCSYLGKMVNLEELQWKCDGLVSVWFNNALELLYKLKRVNLIQNCPSEQSLVVPALRGARRLHMLNGENKDNLFYPLTLGSVNPHIESVRLESGRVGEMMHLFNRMFLFSRDGDSDRERFKKFNQLVSVELVRKHYASRRFVSTREFSLGRHVPSRAPNLEKLIVTDIAQFRLDIDHLFVWNKLKVLSMSGSLEHDDHRRLHHPGFIPNPINRLQNDAAVRHLQNEITSEREKISNGQASLFTSLQHLTLKRSHACDGVDEGQVRRRIGRDMIRRGLANVVQINGMDEIRDVPMPLSCHAQLCKVLLPAFCKLETVELSTVAYFCYESVKDEGRQLLIDILKNNSTTLKVLKIVNGGNVEDSWLSIIAVEAGAIECVLLANCKNVSQAGLDDFVRVMQKDGAEVVVQEQNLGTDRACICIKISKNRLQ